MNTRCSCCIAGGGPGGVMLGVLLARAGVDVVVLEKHRDFLRDFRGDTVHPSTMDVLAELGWLDSFLRLPHQELTRIRAHVGKSEITLADFSHSPTRKKFIAFMPQWDFLNFLADQAKNLPGFALRMETTAEELLENDSHRVVGVRARTAEGSVDIHADLVVAADGRNSVLREKAGLRIRDLGAPIDVLWLKISRRPTDSNDSLGWVQPGRFLAIIDRGDYWQIAFVIQKGGFDEIRENGIDAFRKDLARTAPFLADRVDELRSFDDVRLLVVKVDRLERWWRPGFLCIGDAAHAMSPIGGVGINLAVQDAVAAANVLIEPLRRHHIDDSDLQRIQRRREFPTKATQSLQVAIQEHLLRRVVTNGRELDIGLLGRLLDRIPVLKRLPARIVGVGFRPEHVDRLAPSGP